MTVTTERAPSATRLTGRTLGVVGALLALATAAIHVFEGPEYFKEQAYVGVLFYVGAALLVVAAVGLFARESLAAWTLGATVLAGMLVGGVLSRTTGLPAFKDGTWDLLLLVSFGLEVAYLAAFAAAMGALRARRR